MQITVCRLPFAQKVIIDTGAGQILVDPSVTQEEALGLLELLLPDAHPDVIAHWVESVMPTAEPLAYALINPPEPDLRRVRRGLGIYARAAGWAMAAAIGAVAIQVSTPMGAGPVAASVTWNHPVFQRVQVGSAWQCTPGSELVATCVTADGVIMNAKALVGPDELAFTFDYVVGGQEQWATLRVFGTSAALEKWALANQTSPRPNFETGDRWALYGSEKARIEAWAQQLQGTFVIPGDIAEVALAMGLIDIPERAPTADATTGDIRAAVASILIGQFEPVPPLGTEPEPSASAELPAEAPVPSPTKTRKPHDTPSPTPEPSVSASATPASAPRPVRSVPSGSPKPTKGQR